MVAMRAESSAEAFHEPRQDRPSSPRPSPPFGEERENAIVGRFMVTMRAENGVGAFHEPGSAGVSLANGGENSPARRRRSQVYGRNADPNSPNGSDG